jgi:hypothetical protein
LAEFEAVEDELDVALTSSTRVRQRVRAQTGSSASDVIELCRLLRTAYLEAVNVHTEDVERVAGLRGYADVTYAERLGPSVPYDEWVRLVEANVRRAQESGHREALQKHGEWHAHEVAPRNAALLVLYRSLFFFLCAHQDELYRVLFELETGARASVRSSMGDANRNERDPVGALLRREAPDYLSWFTRWRDLRNEFKYGQQVSLAGPRSDPGLRVGTFTEEGGVVSDLSTPAIRLRGVTEALVESAAIARLAVRITRPKAQ